MMWIPGKSKKNEVFFAYSLPCLSFLITYVTKQLRLLSFKSYKREGKYIRLYKDVMDTTESFFCLRYKHGK